MFTEQQQQQQEQRATAQAQVAAGVEWLDETKPGWRELVKADEFEICSGQNCILGQSFRDEAAAAGEDNGYDFITQQLLDTIGLDWSYWMRDHGFVPTYNAGGSPGLRDAWLRELDRG